MTDDATRTTDPAAWSTPKRLLFRFGLIYFLLYVHPFPLNYVPNPRSLEGLFEADWSTWLQYTDPFFQLVGTYASHVRTAEHWLVDGTARLVFGIEYPLDRPLGSGDPTHSHIRILVLATFALLGTALWSAFARGWDRHPKLAAWLHLAVRFVLLFAMLGYGLAKVIPNQFAPPRPSRLVADFGDSSPMNVLWTFMGTSPAYVVFAGAGEALAAVLLYFRRTATLGALVAAAVMTNVVAMNLCYDVPVKLYSMHLLAFALCICLPDVRRLVNALVLNRVAEPRDLRAPHLPYVRHVVAFVLVAPVLAIQIDSGLERQASRGERPELYGVWDVARFVLDGEELAPLQTDPVRWQNLIVDSATRAAVRGMDDTRWNHALATDDTAGTLTLSSRAYWDFDRADDGTLVLRGEFEREVRPNPFAPAGPDNPADPRGPQLELRLEASGDDPATVGSAGALAGTWRVVSSTVIGPSFTPRRRKLPSNWTAITFADDVARVEFAAGGPVDEFEVDIDADAGRLTLTSSTTLAVERPAGDRLVLRGSRCGHDLEIELTRRDLSEFLVRQRGFRWINEIPLNRY